MSSSTGCSGSLSYWKVEPRSIEETVCFLLHPYFLTNKTSPQHDAASTVLHCEDGILMLIGDGFAVDIVFLKVSSDYSTFLVCWMATKSKPSCFFFLNQHFFMENKHCAASSRPVDGFFLSQLHQGYLCPGCVWVMSSWPAPWVSVDDPLLARLLWWHHLFSPINGFNGAPWDVYGSGIFLWSTSDLYFSTTSSLTCEESSLVFMVFLAWW